MTVIVFSTQKLTHNKTQLPSRSSSSSVIPMIPVVPVVPVVAVVPVVPVVVIILSKIVATFLPVITMYSPTVTTRPIISTASVPSLLSAL
jgi:hypothetical protein